MMNSPINLICIPFAGGTSFAFRDLKKSLVGNINPICIDFPGHGRRIREPLVKDIHDLVSGIFHEIESWESGSWAIWGHSMGGTVAYLLTHRLINSQKPIPLHLFISGAPAPSVPRKEKNVYKLPGPAFMDKVKTYGGVADEVLAEKDLMDIFLPILRADFQALETYKYIKPLTRLPVPITAMLGTHEHVKEEDALPWGMETSEPLAIQHFEGNHFFIFEHMHSIGEMISGKLQKTTRLCSKP
ncbi:MAG: thioesterase [Desulfamplus sp.]|nr:thioesterase [Desulfamplus sp.]